LSQIARVVIVLEEIAGPLVFQKICSTRALDVCKTVTLYCWRFRVFHQFL